MCSGPKKDLKLYLELSLAVILKLNRVLLFLHSFICLRNGLLLCGIAKYCGLFK